MQKQKWILRLARTLVHLLVALTTKYKLQKKTLPVIVNAQTSPKERESHSKDRCTDSFFYWVRKRTEKKLFVLSQSLQLYVNTKLEIQILFVNRGGAYMYQKLKGHVQKPAKIYKHPTSFPGFFRTRPTELERERPVACAKWKHRW